MNLNEITEILGKIDYSENSLCTFAIKIDGELINLGYPSAYHSWRGAYDYLGISLTNELISVSNFIDKINEFEEGNYIGWKGGDNHLDMNTDFFLDNGEGTVGLRVGNKSFSSVSGVYLLEEDNIFYFVCEADMWMKL